MGKRKHGDSSGGGGKKKKWQANTTLSGQGIFMTCPRGKERRAANEFIDILKEFAAKLYPDLSLESLPSPRALREAGQAVDVDVDEGNDEPRDDGDDEDDMDRIRNGDVAAKERSEAKPSSASPPPPTSEAPAPIAPAAKEPEDDIEAELRAELAELKKTDAHKYAKTGKKPSLQGKQDAQNATVPAFRLFETGTECLTFIGVHPFLDPFKLCSTYFEEIEKTAEPKSRLLSRLSPIAGFGNATVQGLNYISERWLPRFFPEGEKGTFKVEPRVRSHNILNRTDIIDTVASHIPRGSDSYQAELKNPSHWVVVEVFKSQAAIGVLRDYTRFNRFNVVEFANAVRQRREAAEGVKTAGGRVAAGTAPASESKTVLEPDEKKGE